MSEFEVPEIDGRVAVSVEFAWNNPDKVFWQYDREARDLGLECWREIDDLDKSTLNTRYYLFGKEVKRGHIVYMQVQQQ